MNHRSSITFVQWDQNQEGEEEREARSSLNPIFNTRLEEILHRAYEGRESKPRDLFDTDSFYLDTFKAVYADPTEQKIKIWAGYAGSRYERIPARANNSVQRIHLGVKIYMDYALLKLREIMKKQLKEGIKIVDVRMVLENYKEAGKFYSKSVCADTEGLAKYDGDPALKRSSALLIRIIADLSCILKESESDYSKGIFTR